MVRDIIWSKTATNELRKTLEYWMENNESSLYSERIFAEAEKVLELVSRFPEVGRKTTKEGIRRVVVFRKYGIYYSWNENKIEVKLWRSLRMNPKENKYET